MNIKLKTTFKCPECNFEYHSAPWEPRWLARKAYEPAHAALHDNPETHPTVLGWREWEQERIINLLEEQGNVLFDVAFVVALIKGENKND